jgi:hypothetical protein
MDVLLRIISGVCEDAGKDPSHYSVSTFQNDTMAVRRNKIFIQ